MDKYEPILSIGIVAKKLGVAVQTVRLYEQQGLVLPFKAENGHRLFSTHDLEHLQCVRKMITKNGINIQGIKRIMAFIPCWEFKGGLDSQCRGCSAYYDALGPCWSTSNKGMKCKLEDCRSCAVYKIEFNCTKLKEIIFGHKKEDQNKRKDSL